MSTTLPTAAWFAEHVMGWTLKRGEGPRDEVRGTDVWVDKHGLFRAYAEPTSFGMWDPHVNLTDAMQLWGMLPNPKELRWNDTEKIAAIIHVPVAFSIVRTAEQPEHAICAAVAAWVESKEAP